MKTLQNLLKLKASLSEKKFVMHCKNMLLEKENYSKLAIQKAQQFIDEYSKPSGFYLS